MSKEGLFHIDESGELVSMSITPYEAESLLQGLLENYPDLLAGGQMTPDDPRRWALVKREQGVPDRDSSSARWSVDHLFVDQDAIPTLVEVKRSSDTRIRREVVGQMLDYAANGVRYWPIGDLQLAYESTQRELGRDPGEVIHELCGDRSLSVEAFFDRVADNLRGGKIRMVFVADVIPDELMRITEFLNEQMSPAEVFAVEVKQFKAPGHGGTVIVPAVFGRTASASVKNSRQDAPSRAELLETSSVPTRQVLERLAAVAEEHDGVMQETPSGVQLKTHAGRTVATLYFGFDALDVPVQPMRERGFDVEADAIHARLQQLTLKLLTLKTPSLPVVDVIAHWSEVVAILGQAAEVYNSSQPSE